MSGSFSVDVEHLGQIPRQLSTVRTSVASIRVGQFAGGAGAGARRFASALDEFAGAGAAAIEQDAATLADAATAYQRSDQRVVRATTTVERLLLGGR